MTGEQILQEAASSGKRTKKKSADEVVAALLRVEKKAKKEKISYSLEQLIGTWRLCFVTGTKKTRKRAGIILGSGKYIPRSLYITITYSKDEDYQPNVGKVTNCVDLKLIKLSLTGLTKFITPQNILAFDFTRMELKLGAITVYKGYIRSGKEKEANFETEPLKKQAFFSYFFIDRYAMAARGRGGGLALWSRVN